MRLMDWLRKFWDKSGLATVLLFIPLLIAILKEWLGRRGSGAEDVGHVAREEVNRGKEKELERIARDRDADLARDPSDLVREQLRKARHADDSEQGSV